MSLTHSIPDSLTLHCCWKTQTCEFCIRNVWLQSDHQVMMSKKPGFTSGPRWDEEKRIPFLPNILFVVENRLFWLSYEYLLIFFNGLTLVPGIATITRVQAPPLVVCKMMITIACITCSVITLFVKFTFKECLTSNAVPYLETISTQRRVRKVRRTCFKYVWLEASCCNFLHRLHYVRPSANHIKTVLIGSGGNPKRAVSCWGSKTFIKRKEYTL